MKVDKELIKHLAETADIINTISGGMSEGRLDIKRFENHYKVDFRMAGLNPEKIDIQIEKGNLVISSVISLQDEEPKKGKMPFIFQILPLPYDVDFDNISGKILSDHIILTLPLNTMSSGFQKGIDLSH